MNFLFCFALLQGAFAQTTPNSPIDAAIRKNIELSKQYDLRIDQRAIATMHVFVLREAKNSCSYQSDDPAKESACLQKAFSRTTPGATELCAAVKAKKTDYTTCLRNYIQTFTPSLKEFCANLKGYRASACNEAAEKAESSYQLFKDRYNKDADGRDPREARTKTVDYAPDSAFQTKLMAFSDSRETKKASSGFWRGQQ